MLTFCSAFVYFVIGVRWFDLLRYGWDFFAIAGRDSVAEFLGGGVRDCCLGGLMMVLEVLLMGVVILVISGEYQLIQSGM